jgi:threonine dehydrogenase-like Zn-dependent dehydrogenase
MRAAIMYGAGEVRVENVPDPKLEQPTDALVRIVRACVCGSDLHPYHQMPASEQGSPMGHEFVGVVEEVGSEVHTLKAGDFVIAPFAWSDNTCDFCCEGVQTSCRHGGFWARNGIGGAVGLSAVLAARRLGAETIILMGRHTDRTNLGREWGATDVVAERGDEGVSRVLELTGGDGTAIVVEAVGLRPAYDTAVGVVRVGGTISRVGAPQYEDAPIGFASLFGKNITLTGGPSPVRGYIEELLPEVLEGRLQPGKVFDRTVDLDGVPEPAARGRWSEQSGFWRGGSALPRWCRITLRDGHGRQRSLRAGSQEGPVDLLGRALGSLWKGLASAWSPAHLPRPRVNRRAAQARRSQCRARPPATGVCCSTAGEPACCSVGTVGQASDVVRCCPSK